MQMTALLANWKLVLLGLMAAGLVVAGVLLKSAWAENGAIQTKLDAAAGVIKQAEEDKVANAKAVQQLAQKLTDTETKVVTVTEKVYAAPVTRDCAQSPAMRAASDGLRQLFPVGQADDRRQPAAAVPGSAAGTGGAQR
jgi:hypothetical protein